MYTSPVAYLDAIALIQADSLMFFVTEDVIIKKATNGSPF